MFVRRGLRIAPLLAAAALATAICLSLMQPIRALPGSSVAAANAAAGGRPVGGPFTIADTNLAEEYPAVAYNPDRQHYLVVWHNDRPGNDDIQAQKVSRDGNLIGGPFFVAAGEGAERRFPDIAYNSDAQQYLVVWEEYNHTSGETTIRARRLTGTGAIDGSVFNIFDFNVSGTPAVAYASTSQKYLVVWWWFDLSGHHIAGRTYSPAAGLGGTQLIHEDTGGDAAFQPDVAYCRTRNEHLVVWQAEKSNTDHDIHGRRVTGNGDPLSPAAIFVSTLGWDESEPAVAALPITSNQGDYLVAWELDFGTERGVRSRTVHVATDGSPSLGIYQVVGDHAGRTEQNPAVAGHEASDEYLVTWQQEVWEDLGGGYLIHNATAGRAVASSGSPLGSDLRVIGGWETPHGAVAAGDLGHFLVVFDDSLSSGNSGTYGRFWGNRVYLPLLLRNG